MRVLLPFYATLDMCRLEWCIIDILKITVRGGGG